MVAVQSPTRHGSGYVVAPRLVLTSAHATGEVDTRVTVFAAGAPETWSGVVVWRGAPGGRDDAALVAVDDPAWSPPAGHRRSGVGIPAVGAAAGAGGGDVAAVWHAQPGQPLRRGPVRAQPRVVPAGAGRGR